MDRLLERVTQIIHDVFDDPTIAVTSELSAHDVEAWDSLTHVNLILAAEQEFNVRFSSMEVARMRNVGDLVSLILSKQ